MPEPEDVLRYVIVYRGEAITCLTCGLTSFHPQDVAERYCGRCRVFHEDEARRERLQEIEAMLDTLEAP